jgi:hypothetical protein
MSCRLATTYSMLGRNFNFDKSDDSQFDEWNKAFDATRGGGRGGAVGRGATVPLRPGAGGYLGLLQRASFPENE